MVVHDLNPVALDLGVVKIHWYGLMYLFAFVGVWSLAQLRLKRDGWKKAEFEDLLFYGAIGVVVGGRLGYALFYDLPTYIENPFNIFKVWQGGMAFHGGLLGVMAAFWYFSRQSGKTFFEIADFIAPLVPIGLLFGRIGNYINGELWGKVTDVSWGVIFPTGGPEPRHPSQLYEAALEGAALFAILWFYSTLARPQAAVSGLFLLGYGCFRFIVEFVRIPDPQYGYLAFGWLTMGQILCLPMILGGGALMIWAYRRANSAK